MNIIQKLNLPMPVMLAPMAGISTLPFRSINQKFGCAFSFLEMINVRSLSTKSKKTRQMLRINPADGPLGIQIIGSEPEYITQAVEIINNYDFKILDFNAACPQKKITSSGRGASLLKTPKKLNLLLKIMIKSANMPVTAKIRLGWSDATYACDIARYAEDSGIKALFVHGRTKEQGYSGRVNYPAIQKIKKTLTIPVIASGDIFSASLTKKMFDETGCDAVAVARGALGNPWIFKEISEFLKNNRQIKPPAISQIINVMREHLDKNVEFFGEKIGILDFRKFFIWYTQGVTGIKPLRASVGIIKTKQAMLELIDEFGHICAKQGVVCRTARKELPNRKFIK